MARAPKPPKIDDDKPFLQYAIKTVLKFIFILWLFSQAMGFIFYALYHYTPIHFREFMFRDYLDFWDRWGDDVMPDWTMYIPTWKSPYLWAIIIFLISMRFLAKQKKATQRNSSRQKSSRQNKKSSRTKSQRKAPPDDDDFDFDESKFKSKKSAFHALRIWRDE